MKLSECDVQIVIKEKCILMNILSGHRNRQMREMNSLVFTIWLISCGSFRFWL